MAGMDFWTSASSSSSSSKQQIHRASLASIALLACIVFLYQSFFMGPQPPTSPSSSNGDFSLSLSPSRASSAMISGSENATHFKPPILVSSAEPGAPAAQIAIPPAPQAPEAAAANLAPKQEQPVEENATSKQEQPVKDNASSPMAAAESETTQKNMTETAGTEAKTVVFNITGSTNVEDVPPDTFSYSQIVKKQREIPEWRARLEQDLRQAKQEIEAASWRTMQLNPQITKSIYLDAYKFQKSYELMEKVFKVYMYKEGEPRLVHRGPLTGIYSSEGRFIHEMNQNSRFITHDPQEAHMFFLPYSVVHMVLDLYVPGSHTMLPLATFIKDYVNLIANKHPFWNMTRGADHFFVSCHDWGPATARDHPELRTNSVKVVCNSDLTEEFVTDKDASLPETYLHTVKLPTRLGGPGPAKRPILAFFAGQMHGRVRPTLLKHWKDKDPDMKIYEVLPREISRRMSYEAHMKSSKFCICAMGFEVNSPRIVESIYYECVPVIIADNFVLPFSDVLNWRAFSLTVEEKDVPRLKEILLGVSDDQYRKMQSRLKRVRQHFLWHDSAEKFDIFHMILHSVWMRRLQQLERIIKEETSI